MPTAAQFLALFQDSAFLLCQHPPSTNRLAECNLITLAGESIEVEILPNGKRIIR